MRNSKCEIRNFFLHKCALLLLLVLLLPLTGCTLSEELLTEKRRVQPFPVDDRIRRDIGLIGKNRSDLPVFKEERAGRDGAFHDPYVFQ